MHTIKAHCSKAETATVTVEGTTTAIQLISSQEP